MTIRKWLFPAGLAIGLAGMLWTYLPAMTYDFTWAKISLILMVLPLAGGAVIARVSPRLGGILTAAYGAFSIVDSLAGSLMLGPTNPHLITADYITRFCLQGAMSYIIPGILFALSTNRSVSGKNSPAIPRTQFTGICFTAIAVVSYFSLHFFKFHDYYYQSQTLLTVPLVVGCNMAIAAVAAWKKPLWGGVMCTAYSMITIGNFLPQATHYAFTPAQFNYEILLPAAMLLAGGLIVLASLVPKMKTVTQAV